MHAAMMGLAFLAAQTTATETLKARDVEIRKALPPADHTLTSGEKSKLENLLTRAVDMPAMARDALGKRWDKVSESERKRYVKAFSERFKKASEGEIDFYRNTEIAYSSEIPSGDDIQVPTTLTLKGEPTPVVYTLRKEGPAFKIVDLSVDGVSTVENYRSSFGRIFDKDGIAGLIAKLQQEPTKPVGK